MDVQIGEDIPLAFIFYFLTVNVPLCYIYFGLKQKDNSYDYLLNIPFRKINKSNLDRYINDSDKIKKEIKELKNRTNKDLWIKDLELLQCN